MRESIRDKERLIHILDAIDKLEIAYQQYPHIDIKKDAVVYYGIVKLIEIIGEASYKLTNEFRDNHTDTPWRKMMGMRNVLVHGYYQISVDDVYSVITNDLPLLRPQIETYINELSQ